MAVRLGQDYLDQLAKWKDNRDLPQEIRTAMSWALVRIDELERNERDDERLG